MQNETGKTPDVSIVIVTYNNENIIGRCLKSLTEASLKRVFEIIVVDNDSNDATVKTIREAFPTVLLLKNRENVGFAQAVNQGIQKTTSQNIILLNSDVLVNEAAMTTLLENCRTAGDNSLFSPRIINQDGTFQETSCGLFPNFSVLATEFLVPYGLARRFRLQTMFGNRKADGTVRYEWLSGACLAFGKKAYRRIGPFDESYFMYFEDVDFCYRAKKCGISTKLLQDIQVLHIGGESFSYLTGKSDRNSYIRTSLFTYIRGHTSKKSAFVLRLLYAFGQQLRHVQSCLKGRRP